MPRRKSQPVSEGSIEDLFGLLEEPEPKPKPEPVEAAPELERSHPVTLDCGHIDWFSPEQHHVAREEGHCCEGGKRGRTVLWTLLRGKHVRPLPKSRRRTREREERRQGFPGYCCDDKGFYIGGIGNDCRRYRPAGTDLCEAHRPLNLPPAEEEEEDDDDVAAVPLKPPPAPAPRRKSTKARQIATRRRSKVQGKASSA